jgi:hypothetical protein
MKISLKANNNQYVCAENGGGGAVIVNRDQAGIWETFELISVDGSPVAHGSRVAFKTYNGNYLCAESAANDPIVANRISIGPWEIFTISEMTGGVIGHGSRITLKAINGKYLCAEGGGGRELIANRNVIGGWETFTFEMDATAEAVTSYAEIDFGGGKHAICNAALNDAGSLSLTSTTWTNSPFQGFTIGMHAYLLDGNGVVLHQTEKIQYGVDGTAIGQSHRMDTKFEQIDPGVAQAIEGIAIALYWAPKWRILEIIGQATQLVADIIEAVAVFCQTNPDVCRIILETLGKSLSSSVSKRSGSPKPYAGPIPK